MSRTMSLSLEWRETIEIEYYDKTRKIIQHHRELSRSGSETEQGCSSASGRTEEKYNERKEVNMSIIIIIIVCWYLAGLLLKK